MNDEEYLECPHCKCSTWKILLNPFGEGIDDNKEFKYDEIVSLECANCAKALLEPKEGTK